MEGVIYLSVFAAVMVGIVWALSKTKNNHKVIAEKEGLAVGCLAECLVNGKIINVYVSELRHDEFKCVNIDNAEKLTLEYYQFIKII